MSVDDYQRQRLLRAVGAAFAVLSDFGFHPGTADIGAARGATVTIASQSVRFVIEADWIERELAVWVHVAGASPVPVQALIPEVGSVLRALPRDATRGVLQRRLERIATALKDGEPELLRGGAPALDRVRQAGAEVEST